MGEFKFDRMLKIKTTGLREWKERHVPYHRYEPTPYAALDKLFETYSLNHQDEFVDFGSGRGRVPIYIHHRFQIPVTGIEVHDKTFEEGLENKLSYRQRAQHIRAPIRFHFGLAEDYPIEPTENTFYFFNPFSIKIYKKVVSNIIHSVENDYRPVDIILYYPMPDYKHFMNKSTPFELINKVIVPKNMDKREKFLIYRLT